MPTVRSIAGTSRNPACQRRAALEIAGRLNVAEVAAACGATSTLVPSRIATARGVRFEETVLGGDAAELRALIRTRLGVTIDASVAADLRRVDDTDDVLAARAEATSRWLRTLPGSLPAVARGAVVRLQLGSLELALELDALVWTGTHLMIVEVKSFATIDAHVAPDGAADAAIQAAAYALALRAQLADLAIAVEVHDSACLITAYNFTLRPTLHVLPLAEHLAILEVALERLADQIDDSSGLPATRLDPRGLGDPAQPAVRAAQAANRHALQSLQPHLIPGCLGRCPMFQVCRDEVRGTPSVEQIASFGAGHAERLAGAGSLQRAAELAAGADPKPDEETVAVSLQQVAALLAAAFGDPAGLRGAA